MDVVIINNSQVPIYEQIINQIKLQIIEGKMQVNSQLPSIRQLAKDLQISVITTKRAYEELEREGMIYSMIGKGFYVSDQNVEILKERQIQLIEKAMIEIIRECKKAGLTVDKAVDMLEILYEGENV
jgi:GntR family transcriptional regulator